MTQDRRLRVLGLVVLVLFGAAWARAAELTTVQRDALQAKKISSLELTTSLVKAVEEARPLNAYVTETPEKALEMAKA